MSSSEQSSTEMCNAEHRDTEPNSQAAENRETRKTASNSNFVQDMTDFIFVEDAPEKADIIFVPGGDQGALAVTAARLYREGYAPRVLPSGRFSKPTGFCQIPGYETEWAFLRDILLREGVPGEAILEEQEATYTYENAIFSRRVTDALGLRIRRAILCPQAHHARRALLYYKILYPDTTFLVCPTVTRGITRENWYRDPEKIDIVLGELERCGSQFHAILREYAAQQKSAVCQDGTDNREVDCRFAAF